MLGRFPANDFKYTKNLSLQESFPVSHDVNIWHGVSIYIVLENDLLCLKFERLPLLTHPKQKYIPYFVLKKYLLSFDTHMTHFKRP